VTNPQPDDDVYIVYVLYFIAGGLATLVMLLTNAIIFLIALCIEFAAICVWVGVRRARERRRLR
jgi:hypothetical protein